MGIIRPGPPEELLLRLQAPFGITDFVETGTYLGDTTFWASQHFERVYSIERYEPLYLQAQARFASSSKVRLLFGDTRTNLPEVVAGCASPAIFWLDAHWSGAGTYGEQDECPVGEEIAIINRSTFDHFICIDDARLFLAPPPPPHQPEQWPTIARVIEALNTPRLKFIVVIDDVIVAVPHEARDVLVRYCQAANAAPAQQAERTSPAASPSRSLRRIARALVRR